MSQDMRMNYRFSRLCLTMQGVAYAGEHLDIFIRTNHQSLNETSPVKAAFSHIENTGGRDV